jgi:integrase
MGGKTKGAPWESRLFVNEQWELYRQAFLRRLAGISGSSASPIDYNGTFTRFFGPEPKRTPDTYRQSELEAFLLRPTHSNRSRGKQLSPASRNMYLSHITSFYDRASQYMIPGRKRRNGQPGKMRKLFDGVSPAAGLDLVEVGEQRHRTMTDDEVARYFAAIPRDSVKGLRDRALYLTYFWSGRRLSEIVRLTWGDLDRHWLFDDGHRGVRYHWRGKGRSRIDDVEELAEPAWTAIEEYLTFAGLRESIQPHEPLFSSLARSGINLPRAPLAPVSVEVRQHEYMRLAGIDDTDITVHSWRHTAAFIRYREDRDILKLQKFLRHKHLDTTQKYVSEWTRQADTTARKLYGRYASL